MTARPLLAALVLALAGGAAAAPPPQTPPVPAPNAAPLSGALALQEAFAQVAAKAKPAVVNISTVHEEAIPRRMPHFFFGHPEEHFGLPPGHPRTYRAEGTGSGFIVDAKGHVLTNEHVIRGASEIKVARTLPDGRVVSHRAKVLGADPGLDLAVVKIESAEPLPHLSFAESASVRVGDWAIAIGSPFELEQTVTAGIVSAVRQSLYIEGRRYSGMIQTDAAINRGNSGGPLLNIVGEVVGVNTAIFSPSGAFAGIGFAISAGEVRPILEELIAGRRIRRGWLGLEAAPVDEIAGRRFGLPEASGALVNSVFADSPAAKAGVRRGDVIVQVDGRRVVDSAGLAAIASRLEPGRKVEVELYRAGRGRTLTITLAERPEWADTRGRPAGRPRGSVDEAPEGGSEHSWEGVTFVRGPDGVTVRQVRPDSRLAGFLQPGDVVKGVDRQEVNTLSDLRRAAAAVRWKDGVFLDIERRGRPMYLSVTP